MTNHDDNQDPFADRVPSWLDTDEPVVPPAVNKPAPGGARRKRTRRIRVATVACSICAFSGVWGVVYTQMAKGEDPALGDSKASTSQTAATKQRTTTDTSSTQAPAAATSAQS